jgi:hypothetical protein
LQPTSKTASRSNEDPSQNCSMLETNEKGTGLRSSWLTEMSTGDGANSGEPRATGEHTRVLKFSKTYWRKASPGVRSGDGRAAGCRASSQGVRRERNPWAAAGAGGGVAREAEGSTSSAPHGAAQRMGTPDGGGTAREHATGRGRSPPT